MFLVFEPQLIDCSLQQFSILIWVRNPSTLVSISAIKFIFSSMGLNLDSIGCNAMLSRLCISVKVMRATDADPPALPSESRLRSPSSASTSLWPPPSPIESRLRFILAESLARHVTHCQVAFCSLGLHFQDISCRLLQPGWLWRQHREHTALTVSASNGCAQIEYSDNTSITASKLVPGCGQIDSFQPVVIIIEPVISRHPSSS